MKRYIYLILLVLPFFGKAQDRPIRFDLASIDTLTTAERDAIPADAAKAKLIFNKTTNQLEIRPPGGSWSEISGSGASQLSDLSDVNTSTPTNRNVLVADGVDFESRALVEADISDFGSYVDLSSNQTIGGNKTYNGISSYNSYLNFQDVAQYYGYEDGVSGKRWRTRANTGEFIFAVQDTPSTDATGSFSDMYSLNSTGTPSAATDLIDKAYADANYSGGGSSLPVDDTTSLVQDPVDNTKQVRIDAGAITTATTRTITMPDADVDLGNIPDLNTVSPPNTLEYARFSDSNTLEGLTAAEVRTDLNIENGAAANQTLSLSGTGNKDLTISGTGGNTIDLTGVDGIDADNIVSKGTARTSPTQYIDIYGQTQANYNTDGAPGAGELVIITDASPAEVVSTATIAMDGWKMYDDQTADAATITLSDCDPGETLTVYINRASAPTLAGTGLTFNQLPNTTAFASATEMMIIFEVAYDGTTIDYYYVER